MDDDSGERDPVEPAPGDAESPEADRQAAIDPRAEDEAALALPRTVTIEELGEPPVPDDRIETLDRAADGAPPFNARARAEVEIQQHLDCLRSTALRLTQNSPEADELLQDTVERALKRGIAADVKCAKSWLCRIMTNLFFDRCRADARRAHHESLDEQHLEDLHNVTPLPLDDPEPDWQRVTIDDVRQALDEITAPFREVYILHEFEHWSYAQIATHLKISTVTVGTRLSRVRERLRGILRRRVGKQTDGGSGEDNHE